MRSKLFYLFFILLFTNCYFFKKEITITDFSKKYNDSLVPFNNGSYSVALYDVEGYTNDTIKVKFYGIERNYIGKFKDEMRIDYYGGGNVYFLFDPYKADSGKVKFNYNIK